MAPHGCNPWFQVRKLNHLWPALVICYLNLLLLEQFFHTHTPKCTLLHCKCAKNSQNNILYITTYQYLNVVAAFTFLVFIWFYQLHTSCPRGTTLTYHIVWGSSTGTLGQDVCCLLSKIYLSGFKLFSCFEATLGWGTACVIFTLGWHCPGTACAYLCL